MTKTILITGGGRGIGQATARLAGKRGWNVGINYHSNAEAAEETVSQVIEAGGQACAISGDVSSEADVVALFDETEEKLGRLDGLVNNAGIIAPAMPLADMTVERMRRVFDINILGSYLCAREAARRLARSLGGKGGAIVNVSSAVSRLGAPNEYVDYAGSKGAIDTLTLGLSKELGPEGIRVNAVRPGIIDTEIHADGGRPDRAKTMGPQVPLGRPGSADEVAQTILWLLGDEASYVNGAIVDVTGGR